MFVKHQRPQFDTFTRRRVGWRGRIDESSMRSKTGPAVGRGIVALQQQRFVSGHFRNVKPAMIRVELDGIGLAAPVGIDQVGRDEIAGRTRLTIAQPRKTIRT